MRRLLLLILLFAPLPARADEADVIVVLRTRETAEGARLRVLAAAQAAVARESRALGAEEIAGLSHLPLLHLRIAAEQLPRLTALPQVQAVYPNHRVTAARTEGGALIGSPQLQTKYKAGGKGVGVAVFDTGIDSSHPELSDHVVAGFDFIGDEPFADRNGISELACHSKVISAGAVYDADVGPSFHGACNDRRTRAGQIACYSNSGNPLDVLAPAEVANTTASGGGYTDFGGTSAATPYVAGVLAQLRSRFPKASAAKIRSALMSTGTPLTDTNGITRRLISGPAAFKKLKKKAG